MRTLAAVLLALAPVRAAAARYDPDQDRAALRRAATASYEAAVRAAGLPLEPARTADIKASLDESVSQASVSSGAARSLEAGAAGRGAEMDSALKGPPAPDAAAKDASAAAATARARWKTLSSDHDALQKRVDALPDKEKAELANPMRRATSLLSDADRQLSLAETAAASAADAASAMALARGKSRGPDGERAAADAEVARLAGELPPPVAEAKDAVDRIGQEPQNVNRTRAGQKLAVPRDLARALFAAADRACNRADEFRAVSDAFDRASAAARSARSDGSSAQDAAKSALDEADRTQAFVRARLDRPKP